MDPSQEPAAKGGIPPKQVLPGPPPGPGTTIYFGSDLGMPPATPDGDALVWCAPQAAGWLHEWTHHRNQQPKVGSHPNRYSQAHPQAQELPFTLNQT